MPAHKEAFLEYFKSDLDTWKKAPNLNYLFATKIWSNFNYLTNWSLNDRFSKGPNKEKCLVPINM